tara:strand:+ start:3931 stop:6156 length:2226 start_codon:yes stop_codon:yes gene_type:complete
MTDITNFKVINSIRLFLLNFREMIFNIFILFFATTLVSLTWLVLTGQASFAPSNTVIFLLLLANTIFIIAMVVLIISRFSSILLAKRKKIAGSSLQIKLITLFGIVSALPALFVAILATITLDRGLDKWFSDRTKSMLEKSNIVANSYLREHSNNLRAEINAMQIDLNGSVKMFESNINVFAEYFLRQSKLRKLSGAYLINRNGDILISTSIPQRTIGYVKPSQLSYNRADEGDIVIFKPNKNNMVSAFTLLPDFIDGYLLLYKAVDPTVINHLKQLELSTIAYDDLEQRRFNTQITFALQYIGFSLVFLTVAMWFSIFFANRMSAPIARLIYASKKVSDGDLDVNIENTSSNVDRDLSNLVDTFNLMTSDLKNQRETLVTNNQLLDERRKFTEAVLSGITSCVISIDSNGHIQIANLSACNFFKLKLNKILGVNIIDIMPEFSDILIKAYKSDENIDEYITIKINNIIRNLHIKITKEEKTSKSSMVIAFDDVTDLVYAQRTSVWADVAKRIAHEIKNPLTPIQLSAERLKRKYSNQITEDIETFEDCTDTIIRQVGDLGKIVDEFSAFAKMPSANILNHDICDTIRQAVLLQKISSDNINFDLNIPDNEIYLNFDRRLLSQAIINIIKNASESISSIHANDNEGNISISIQKEDHVVGLVISDNGTGFPDNKDKLLEPYYTTREMGTGIGLSVVKNIIDVHNGELLLDNIIKGSKVIGAKVQIKIPLNLESNTEKINEQ